MAIIEVYNLSKRYGNITAVENLNLKVEEGEVLGLLGPNGAGKTTTIRMMAGIIAPTSGYASIAGQRTDDETNHLHEIIGLLTETPGFYETLNARRNLEYFAGFYSNCDVKAQAEKYLKIIGLWERRESRVGTFSKGMKQRLALARSLIHEPKVLFLDEPTAGLDPEAAQEVRELVKRLSKAGRTVFISTHNLTEAEELCHRIAVIRTRLLALDTGPNLRRRFFQHELIIQLETIPAIVLESVKNLKFVKDVKEEGTQMVIELNKPDQNRPELVKAVVEAGGRIIQVTEREHPLEEIYLKLIREEN